MSSAQTASSLYINLLKRTLIGFHNIGTYEYHPLPIVNANWKTAILYPVNRLLRTRNFSITKLKYVSEEKRLNGYDWPADAHTMIGLNRLNNIESCVQSILRENISGDFLEAGVWRGGAVILMRALLKEAGISNRKVWLADSFKGLPKPNPEIFKSDEGNTLHKLKILSVSQEEVMNNFLKYDLLDEHVCFLKGWFKETLPDAPVKQLALLRIDADMYESTIQVLTNLYPKLSEGGYVIVDDYSAFPNCKQAVDDYRKQHEITNRIIEIDKEAIYWRK